MPYRHLPPLLIFTMTLVVSACSDNEQETVEAKVSRPVKTMIVEDPIAGGIRRFPARIDANKRADLSFRVSGEVKELLIKEGDRVDKGQVAAKLDPRDYQIVVDDRKATYDKARKNFHRAKELIGKGHISKADYDRLEAEFKNARATLEKARQDLEYTVLKTPFKGVIAKRHIEQFEEIRPMQPVLELQNIDELEVKFSVPESIVRSLRSSGKNRDLVRNRIKVYATFAGLAGQRYPLTFKELATKADPNTQTYQVTYTMQRPDGATVLPGMTATVVVDLSEVPRSEEPVFLLPATAVVGDFKLEPHIWVVDEQSMTVKSQPVKVGQMSGEQIEVLNGVTPGMRVVTAGAAFLVDDMKINLLPEREEAEPRADEPMKRQ